MNLVFGLVGVDVAVDVADGTRLPGLGLGEVPISRLKRFRPRLNISSKEVGLDVPTGTPWLLQTHAILYASKVAPSRNKE